MNKTNKIRENVRTYIYIYIYIYRSHAIGLKNLIKKARSIRTIGFIATFSFLLLALCSIFPITNHQDKAEATYTPSISEITITSTSNVASVEIAPNSSNGTFATSDTSEEIAFAVTTTNLTGYNLTVNNVTGNTSGQLINASSGDTIDTLSSTTDEATFASGDSNIYNNKWGIKSSKYNSSTSSWVPLASGNYLPAPKLSSTTLDITSTPNSTPNQYTLGVGARVDYEKSSGTYTNTFILQATGNAISYQINYLDNSSDTATVTPTLPSAEGHSDITASKFTLSSDLPARSNWVFIGWCDGTVTHPTNNNSTCTGTTYQPGNDYVFTSLSSSVNTANLYAMWGVPIQNLNTSLCTTTARTVYDIRDREPYLVQKLADNNCWVLDNLRLDISNTSVQANLTSTTTNATDTTLNYLKNGGGSSPYPASGVSSAWTSTDQNSYNLPYIATGDKDVVAPTTYGSGSGKIGVFYNYCAATAGSYCYASDYLNASNAMYDVCPAGWRMPTGGPNGEYQLLYTAYSSNQANFKAALSTPISGYFISGSNRLSSGYGYFWSSSINHTSSNKYIYNTYITESKVNNVDYNNYRPDGFSIRCIRKGTTISGITNMQQITPSIVANTSEDATATLKDTRDNQTYSVRKLNGDLWMTRNLAIGCAGSGGSYSASYVTNGRTLTSANSNVSTSYTTTRTPLSTGNSYTAAYQTCNATYGAWYNYAAATAGTIKTETSTANATYDICPLGWNMPTIYQFRNIYNKRSNFGTVYGGVWQNGAQTTGSTDGTTSNTSGWWSSTHQYNNDVLQGRLYIHPDNLWDTNNFGRAIGLYVRCVAKN